MPDEDSGCCGWKSVRIPPNDWDCCNVGEVSMVDLLDGSLLLLLDEDEDLKLLDSSSIGSDFMADDVIASSASIDCHSLSSVSSLWEDLPAAISAISVAAAEARRKKRRRGEEREKTMPFSNFGPGIVEVRLAFLQREEQKFSFTSTINTDSLLLLELNHP